MSELQLGLGLGLGISVPAVAAIAYCVYIALVKANKKPVAACTEEDRTYGVPDEAALAVYDPHTNAQVIAREEHKVDIEAGRQAEIEAAKRAVYELANQKAGVHHDATDAESVSVSVDGSHSSYMSSPSGKGPSSGAGALPVPHLAIHPPSGHPISGLYGVHGTPLPMVGGGASGAGSGSTPLPSATVPGASLSGLGSSHKAIDQLIGASNLYAGKEVRTARPSTVGRGRRASINDKPPAFPGGSSSTSSHPVSSLTSASGGGDLDDQPTTTTAKAYPSLDDEPTSASASDAPHTAGAGAHYRTESVAALVSTFRPHVVTGGGGGSDVSDAAIDAQQVTTPLTTLVSPADGFTHAQVQQAQAEIATVAISAVHLHPQEGAVLDSAAKAHGVTTMQRLNSQGESMSMFEQGENVRAVLKASRAGSPYGSDGRDSVKSSNGRASARGGAKVGGSGSGASDGFSADVPSGGSSARQSPSASAPTTAGSAVAAGATPPFQAAPVAARRPSLGGGVPKAPTQPQAAAATGGNKKGGRK